MELTGDLSINQLSRHGRVTNENHFMHDFQPQWIWSLLIARGFQP